MFRRGKVLLFLCFFSSGILFPGFSKAQDTTNTSTLKNLNYIESANLVPKDTVKKKVQHRLPDPKGAMYRSIIIPGLGQLYNRQYWKVPVLYAGFGICIYSITFASNHYQTFRKAYIYRTDRDSMTIDPYDPRLSNGNPKYSEEQLKVARDYYRRNFELSIIITGGVYILNVLDAYVSAQLMKFDIDDDISMKIDPVIPYSIQGHDFYRTGITLTF